MESALLSDVIVLLSLLAISTLVYHLCKRIQIPFAVGLLFSGLVLAFLSEYTDFGLLGEIEFSPEMVFYIFLPSLIFESAYHMNFQSFKGVMNEIITLSTLGLLISILIISYTLHITLQLPLGVAFLFGSLISATDPVAVLAIFKEVKVPRRLSTILDGESLVNDATALMMFQVFMGLLATQTFASVSTSFVAFRGLILFQIITVSLLIGGVLGFIFSYAIAHAHSHKVQITLSLILAHSTFILSERFFEASGILATLVAGIIVGNFGKMKLPRKTQQTLSEIWDFLGFLANALIFILLGLKLGQVHFQTYWYMVLIAAVVTILLARPLAVFISMGLTNYFRSPEKQFDLKSETVVAWGGMRGALAAAAVLLVPQDYAFAPALQAMTAGVILMTFLLNALSMKPLLLWLGFGKYTANEEIQRFESQLLVNEKILDYLDYMLEMRYITPKLHKQLIEKYRHNIKDLSKSLLTLKKHCKDHPRETEKILSQYALGIELRTYARLYEYREIDESRYRALRGSVERQLQRLEDDELPDETKKTTKIAPRVPHEEFIFSSVKTMRQFFWKVFERYRHYKIISRWQHYRARRIASWKVIRDFELLYQYHEEFKDSAVVRKIIDRYRGWHANSKAKIQNLEKEFPELLEKTQVSFVERMCLNKERDFEREFFEKGLINVKVYKDIEKEIKDRTVACQGKAMRIL